MKYSTNKSKVNQLLKKGSTYLRNKQFSEAIIQYHEVINLDKFNIKAWQWLGLIYKRQGKTQEAINCFRKLIEIKPQEVKFYYNLAELLRRQPRNTELTSISHKIINLDPKQPLWIYENLLTRENKDFYLGQALEIYQKSLVSQTHQPAWLYTSLGRILYQKHKFSESIKIYLKALEIYPNDSQILLIIGDTYYKLGQLDKAVLNYQKSLSIKERLGVYIQLGKIYQKQEEFDNAIRVYQQVLQSHYTENLFVYIGLGNCYLHQNQWNQAIEQYKKAIPLCSSRHGKQDIHNKLRNFYLKIGKKDLALEEYKLEIMTRSIVDHQHKMIYCPIPKNACTFLKKIMVNQSSEREKYQESGLDIHAYASGKKDTNLVLSSFDLLNDENYFKFTVIRNPFERLVSAFLDKLVKCEIPESFAQNLIINVQKSLGIQHNLRRSISFKELVNYLYNTEDYLINAHWRSQHDLLGLGLFKLDYIGQFEELESTITFLENKFNFKVSNNLIKQDNKITKYSDQKNSRNFSDVYPSQLRQMSLRDGSFPKANLFYTTELIKKVQIRFESDINMYQQQFNQTLEEIIPYLEV